MKALEEKILKEGTVLPGNILRVGSFLNHQLDVKLLSEMGKELKNLYNDSGITKVLTIEASGIGIACVVARHFNVPVVFAKKNKTGNLGGEVYKTVVHSYTHGKDYDVVVSREFLDKDDRILIVDDFLANGKALLGLIDIVHQAGAELVGATCAIEQGFQHGGDKLREMGYRVESLAIVEKMGEDGIVFRS